MNPSTKQHQITSDSKQAIQQDAKGLFQNLKIFLVELFDFREDTDQEATIEAIKADIPFKGATAWILIFAVFVASIGLNADSTAVVIGAMLISPLMGPILGIGMSFALNDFLTFKESLMHLGTMIVLRLFASFLFFFLIGYLSKFLSKYAQNQKIWKVINIFIITFMSFLTLYIFLEVI